MCPAAFDRKPSSDLRRGRYPHRPAVRPEYSFQSRRGAASPTPCDRRNSSYILECERQRRRKQVDTKLGPRPIDNPLADRKGSQETIRFPALLWGPSVRTESTPPEEEHADSITNPPEKTHSLRKRVGSECYLQIIAAEIRVGLAAHGDIALTAAQHDDRRAGQAVVI